jgi:DNA-binding beta-propeller fold protein YncE
VAEYMADRIAVMDATGTVIERVGGRGGAAPGALDAPSGVAVRHDTTFVADFYNHRVQALAGGTVNVLGHPGRWWKGHLHYPTDVAVDDSLVYMADAYNHRVQVFTPGGNAVRRWGGPLGLGIPGPFRGWFRVATGIAVPTGVQGAWIAHPKTPIRSQKYEASKTSGVGIGIHRWCSYPPGGPSSTGNS